MLLCDQIGMCYVQKERTELSFFDYVPYHKDNIVQTCILLLYLVHLHQKLLKFDVLFRQAFDQ